MEVAAACVRSDGYVNRPALASDIAFAAGALLANARDLARLPAALAAGELLPPAAVARGWTAARGSGGERLPFDYGFGWFLGSYRGARFVQHGGGTPGFSSVVYWFPAQRLAVVALTNRGDRMLDALAIDVAGLVEPSLRRSVAAADPDRARTARLRQVVAGLLTGTADVDVFTPPMRSFLATTTGKGLWQWHHEHGELGEFTFAAEESDGDERVVHCRAMLGTSRHWLQVRIDAAGAIAQTCWW